MRPGIRILLVLGLVLALTAPAQAVGQDRHEPDPVPLVVVTYDGEDELAELVSAGLDIVDVDGVNEEVFILVHDHEREYFAARGIDYEVIEENLNVFPEPSFGALQAPGEYPGPYERTEYRYLEDYYEELEAIAEAYPDITRLETIGTAHEDLPIVALEIADAPGAADGRPEHVHMALHHSREWPSGELALDLAWYLVENYGDDGRVTDIIDSIRTYVIPVVTPDGFNYSRTVSPLWRKNRNPEGTVDSNRNYGYMWGGPGSSGNPNSNTYRGVAPFSEPETATIRDFYADKHLVTTITGHTHGGWWLFPWGHKFSDPPDEELFELAERSVQWSDYIDGPTAQVLYQASGDTTDWAYGVYRSLAYTPEYGTVGQFHPPLEGIPQPFVLTDDRRVEGRPMTGSIAVEGQSGHLVDCGLALEPSDCPENTEGAIALIERGQETFANKGLNAAAAGAVGAVIYNNTGGHISGTLGGVSVPVPVMGIPRADGLALLDDMAEDEVEATIDVRGANSYVQLWEEHLPAFLENIEAADEFAARIQGSVSSADTGELLPAELELFLERRSFDAADNWAFYEHETRIETDGEFDWAVLPSDQPELETDPYTLTMTAENHFPAEQEVTLSGFGEVAEVDVALQPLAEVLEAHQLEAVQRRSTLPFRFVTYTADGVAADAEDVSVTVLDDSGAELASYDEGRGAGSVRPMDDPGAYIVNVQTNHLGLDAGTYDLVVEFTRDGTAYHYTTTMEVVG